MECITQQGTKINCAIQVENGCISVGRSGSSPFSVLLPINCIDYITLSHETRKIPFFWELGVEQDPGYQYRRLPAMVPLTGPQRPADNKTSPIFRTRNFEQDIGLFIFRGNFLFLTLFFDLLNQCASSFFFFQTILDGFRINIYSNSFLIY